jgi:hypothetical protein
LIIFTGEKRRWRWGTRRTISRTFFQLKITALPGYIRLRAATTITITDRPSPRSSVPIELTSHRRTFSRAVERLSKHSLRCCHSSGLTYYSPFCVHRRPRRSISDCIFHSYRSKNVHNVRTQERREGVGNKGSCPRPRALNFN